MNDNFSLAKFGNPGRIYFIAKIFETFIICSEYSFVIAISYCAFMTFCVQLSTLLLWVWMYDLLYIFFTQGRGSCNNSKGKLTYFVWNRDITLSFLSYPCSFNLLSYNKDTYSSLFLLYIEIKTIGGNLRFFLQHIVNTICNITMWKVILSCATSDQESLSEKHFTTWPSTLGSRENI